MLHQAERFMRALRLLPPASRKSAPAPRPSIVRAAVSPSWPVLRPFPAACLTFGVDGTVRADSTFRGLDV